MKNYKFVLLGFQSAFLGLAFGTVCCKIAEKNNSFIISNSASVIPDSIAEDYSGAIEYSDLDDYISNKYSAGSYSLVSEGTLSGLSLSSMDTAYFTQMEESVFVRQSDHASEGNCGLVSISNGLEYYRANQNFYQIPSASTTITVIPYANSAHFMSAVEAGYAPKSSNVVIHRTYSIVRDYAISAGYVVSGMNDTQTEYAFESAASNCGYTGSFEVIDSFTVSDVVTNILNNIPLQLRVQGDVYYSGHGMMITGYRYYSGTIVSDSVTMSSTLLFASVFDGHSANERWYDVTLASNVPAEYNRATNMSIAKLIVTR